MGALRNITLLVALAIASLVAGCGDSGDGKAETRPAELFTTPPSGLKYEVPDDATLKQVKDAIKKDAPMLDGDDVAVRQLVKEGGGSQPVAIGVVIDAHNEGDADDAREGFSKGLKERTGKEATTISVAGTEAVQGEVAGLTAAMAAKNGYVLEALGGDAASAKTVLARLVFAADKAER